MRSLAISCALATFFASPALAATFSELPPATLSLRFGVTLPIVPLSLQGPADSGLKPLQYSQNSSGKMGVGVDYSWLGFFLSLKDMPSELDASTHGSSEYQDFQLHSYMGAFGADLFYQDFKGYYLQNTEELSGAAGCCLLRSDLQSRFVGANLFWALKPDRLSMGTTNNLTGIQKQSAGSFMLFASGSRQEILSDAVLAPAGFEQQYGVLGNARSARFTTTTLGLGYGYTGMLMGPFFMHLTGLAGVGPQWQLIETRDQGTIDEIHGAIKISLRGTLGWSLRRSFGGVQVLFDSTNFQIKDESLMFNSILTFLSIGVRI